MNHFFLLNEKYEHKNELKNVDCNCRIGLNFLKSENLVKFLFKL